MDLGFRHYDIEVDPTGFVEELLEVMVNRGVFFEEEVSADEAADAQDNENDIRDVREADAQPLWRRIVENHCGFIGEEGRRAGRERP
jgi:hypothetical protein